MPSWIRETGRGAVLGLLSVVLLGGGLGAQDQTSADTAAHVARAMVMTFWTAGAQNQPVATRYGYRYDRGLYLAGVQLRRVIAASDGESLTLAYAVDLLPVIMSSGMSDYKIVKAPCGTGHPSGCTFDSTVALPPHTTYGFGVVPLGFLLRWQAGSMVGLQLRASGGAAYFTSPVPDPLASRFNFLADVGVLTDIRLTHRVALVAGTRLHHISNGKLAQVNPGMNSHMVELGLSFTR